MAVFLEASWVCVETEGERGRTKKNRHHPLASFPSSPSPAAGASPRARADRSLRSLRPYVARARVPEELDVSGDDGMDSAGEKGGDAAAAAVGEAGSDLYAVLGLKKECSDAELKVAYRKLAMRWHPDKCSSSSSVKHMEEAKEKFQEIQSAYSVLSDANKRFLYDVGVYDDEEDEDSLQGMGDFIGEMAQMMSQARPTRQESFEELQQLFVDMFQSDLHSGFCNGPTKGHQVHGQAQSRTPSTSPSSSPSPPPPTIVTEADVPSCNGVNKRGSSAMDSAKPPRSVGGGAGQSQAGFCFGMSDTKQAQKPRGPNTSRRRNGRKQKLSSKHDVSSEDGTAASQHQQHVQV